MKYTEENGEILRIEFSRCGSSDSAMSSCPNNPSPFHVCTIPSSSVNKKKKKKDFHLTFAPFV